MTDSDTKTSGTKDEAVLTDVSVEEWIQEQTFRTTGEVDIPAVMSDRVIGQD